MKNWKIRIIAVLALLMLTLSCLVSCNKEDEKTNDSEASSNVTTDTKASEDSTKATTDTKADEESEKVIAAEGLWKDATYRKDVTVGQGSKEVKINVEIEKQIITITVKTDKEKLGDALFAESLINNASFFDTLNGVKADWDKDQAYWAFYKGEEYMMAGVNDTTISGGESYRFVYTK